ncbi:hypothetical protein OV208_15710 [Corallococcus sp. bb12-1]|uniref:hypothetical protein n=1 Tax=Corallococcus sp. bb12-1 TaxID=2996784 RepID=UPI00226D4606|nr:hypothetical protein [Corallococcus sp. bb12-1]MCY1042771.1 hypothetical protein [Corallococcus sp. bb12-1]
MSSCPLEFSLKRDAAEKGIHLSLNPLDQGFVLNIVHALAKPFSSTPEQGADSLIWLATSPEAASLMGEYVSKRRPVKPRKQALDPKLAADLWTLSEKLWCMEGFAR